MASKFFNRPQLGQTQMTQAESTNLEGVNNNANVKAEQASRSIDMLNDISKSAIQVVGTGIGRYQENVDKKLAMESYDKIPSYNAAVRSAMSEIKNLDSMDEDAMKSKIKEINESFMKGYDDSPFREHLKADIQDLNRNVMTQMLTGRDNLHIKKVSDSTAGAATQLSSQFSLGNMPVGEYTNKLTKLISDSRIAHQVPTSNTLGVAGTEKYMALTQKQATQSVIRGILTQTSAPNSSILAKYMNTNEFKKVLGISEGNSDYTNMIVAAINKGEKADRFNYATGLTTLKDGLYTSTNQGISVNIDNRIEDFKAEGNDLTAQDEHKLRKEFKIENDLVVNSTDYVHKLTEGVDLTAGMTSKDREAVYNRSFTDTLDITGSGASIGNISGSLSDPENQQTFKDYIQSGGKIPKAVIGLFDVPAGSGVEKWDEAETAIMSMEAAAAGSGHSIESIIGVNQVSKIRGLSKLLNDDRMDEATKKNAIEAFHTRSATFNSKGYLQGTAETPIDTEWLQDASKDANWTTDDYVSNQQNADEISGNYQAYRLAGHDESTAQSMALDLFKQSNTSFEMPNGGEIAIPRDHVHLNNESILAFSKDSSRFPSLKEQRDDLEILTGEGWISEWRADSSISIQKSYNFAKTGKYDMMYDNRLVKDSSFTYSELQDFIGKQDHKTRTKITGVKSERPFSEVEAEALENRGKKVKAKLSSEDRIQHIFDLSI